MVPWWKRLSYGLLGWLIATCVAGLLASIWMFTHFPAKRSVTVSDVLSFLLLFLISALAVSVFGWLLGIPYVLLVRSSRGRRFWIYLAVGSAIGPVLVLGPLLYSFLTGSSSGNQPITGPYLSGGISVVISGLSTLIYLLLLRRAQAEQSS